MEMMMTMILETVLKIVTAAAVTAIGVGGAWLTAKIGKKQQLQNIALATHELIGMAQTTVMELQQTVVDGLKSSHEDGKLTRHEIDQLGDMLVDKTVEKMSASAMKLLAAAEVDISAVIRGAGEAYINAMKR